MLMIFLPAKEYLKLTESLVWHGAPTELAKHLENPPQNLIELFPRLDDDVMKKVVQEVLRGLHLHYAGFPELKERFLKNIFGIATV